MRKWVLSLASLVLVAAACSEETPPTAGESPSGSAAESELAAECTAGHAADLLETETLTVGTDFDFMFPPWILVAIRRAGRGSRPR